MSASSWDEVEREFGPVFESDIIEDEPPAAPAPGEAMSGIVMDDDSQIEDERWIKAGYDKDNPRVEITVTPMEAAA